MVLPLILPTTVTLVMQDIVDQARVDLNDANADDSKRRAPDDKLLGFANEGLLEAKTWRPDLWDAATYYADWTPLGLGDAFPLPPQYRVGVQHYVVYRAERRDDEYVLNERAATAYKLCLANFGVAPR